MCWPEIVGGVEVEERRPRTWNEPRRKRLNFVRGHQRDSDDWMVTTPHPRRLTEQEIWDRRRARELQQQMHPTPHPQLQGYHNPQMVQMQPPPPQWPHIQPGGHHGHQPGFDQHGQHGHHPQLDHRSHHSEDDIIGIEDMGHDDHDDHDDGHHVKPLIVHLKPPKSHLPRGLKTHSKKSGGHKKKHSLSSSSSSSDDSSSSDGSSGFIEGFRAGQRSLSRRPMPRGRSRSRLTDDSFEDLMHLPLRSRSRRGRR